MRRTILPVWTAIGALLILVALTLLGHYKPRTIPKAGQEPIPGQAAGTTSQVYLRGGLLQQNLGAGKPEEFIEEETGKSVPSFDTRSFTVHTGKIVSVTLRNDSTTGHEHGWVLVTPGTRKKAEAEAKAAGPRWGWIPNSADILAFVPMTQPGQSRTALFRAPPPGDYPFFCPFPGHGNIMNGVLHVIQ